MESNVKKSIVFAFILLLISLLASFTHEYFLREQKVHKNPTVPLQPLTRANLFSQTGITELGLTTIIDQFGLQSSDELINLLKEYQIYYHTPVETSCEYIAGISCEDFVVPHQRTKLLPIVEDGDILITFSAHTGIWRNGHAALVIDAKEKQTIESTALGTDSSIQNLSKWTRYPNYAVFRLRADLRSDPLIQDIIQYATDNLLDIPYNFMVGIFPSKANSITDVIGTQCSHLVWQAYAKYGIDLDADGGLICTPKDLFFSPYLELVQIYGIM